MIAPGQGPLVGKRVVLTQAAHQAPELVGLLAACGAIPLLYPCIAIAPPGDPAPLDTALRRAVGGEFDWLVFTSANTVRVLAQRLVTLGLEREDLRVLAIAAIGPATAAAVGEHLGRAAEVVAEAQAAEGLAAALTATLAPGQRVLLPQADIARPVLIHELAAAGLVVTPVTAYRTTVGSGGVDLPALLTAGGVDAILFTSGSTVHNLLTRLQDSNAGLRQLNAVCIACIGPVTAAAARDAGLAVAVVAETQSLEGLVEALGTHWRKQS